ncbi:MAG: pitrilysin family protein [Thermoplasmata archaeon]
MARTSSPTDPLLLEYGEEVEGLRVVRQPSPTGAASFSASYVGPGGWGFDPVGEEGSARVVNLGLTSAAGRYDRVALARRLDRAGATLSRQTSPEAAEVTVWGPAEDWTDLLGILADVILRPRFEPDDLARIRRQIYERQLREATQPGSRAELELLRAVYPSGHPYRATGLGDRRSVERLTRARLQRFHRDHYTSGGGLLVVTAPATLSAVQREARERFGRFSEVVGPVLRVPALPSGPAVRRTIDLPGRSQVEVRVGGPSVDQTSPEYPAAFLANEILGGRPLLARLFQRVREKSGLAYHASSHLDTMRFGGIWTAQAGTAPERWEKVAGMLEGEVDRLRREPVSSRELNSVRESAIGEIPLSLESTADAHELALDAAYHGLPADYWRTWPAQLRAVRPADVLRGARVGFDRNRSVTIAAGPIGST